MVSTAQIIGVKQFHKDLKKITEMVQKGHEYVVVKNSKPVFRIVPLDENKKAKKSLHEEFKHLHFKTDNPNLSKEIDKILYGSDS